MTVRYIEQIEDQIAHHRRELQRLEIALSVLAEMSPQKPVQPQAMITVRKIASPESKPSVGQGRKDNPLLVDPMFNKTALSNQIAHILRKEPKKSGDIVFQIKAKPSKEERQRVFNVLYDMKSKGLIDRNETGEYFRVGEHKRVLEIDASPIRAVN
jgi:hypothetical protein